MAELITMCALGGKGLSPKLLVYVDGSLIVAVAISGGLYGWDIVDALYSGYRIKDQTRDIVVWSLMILLV